MKNKKLLGFIATLMMIPVIGGCNSFFNTESNNVNGIESVSHQIVPEGVEVTIVFDDDSKEPVVFLIPKGTAGVDGNSIQSIVPSYNDAGNLTITINFTDPSILPVTLEIPSNKGIKNLTQELDTDGNTVITIEYTDGTFSNPIVVFKGSTGLSIVDIEPTLLDDGRTELKITMSDSSSYTVMVPAPETGNGIAMIEPTETEDEYVLIIHYTDGREETVSFDKPNRWHRVQGIPGQNEYNDGDFAFDVVGHVIYQKINGVWYEVANLNTDDSVINYSVSFQLNGDGATLTRGDFAYSVPNGKTMYSEHHTMPEASRPNYDFLGWSTVKEPTVVNGWFTDLTPVVCDMTLYAIWRAQ